MASYDVNDGVEPKNEQTCPDTEHKGQPGVVLLTGHIAVAHSGPALVVEEEE